MNSFGERGLLGVGFDPDFASNQFLYAYYTATTPAVHNRISRFKASGDGVVPPVHQPGVRVSARLGDADRLRLTGGAFYNPPTPAFPAAYLGQYFYAEFCSGWIYYLDPGSPATASQFAASISSPVDLKIGPDDSLYYLARGTESVGRIMPSGTVLTAPKNLRIVQ